MLINKIKNKTRKLKRNIKSKTRKYLNKLSKKRHLNKKLKSRKQRKSVKNIKKQKGGVFLLSNTEDNIRNVYNEFMGENNVSSDYMEYDKLSPIH
jgi:hypothetical protein